MAFFAIMAATPEGRIAKYQDFPTKAEADVHRAAFFGKFPDAFTMSGLAAPLSHWLIDMAAKTAVISAPPPPDYDAIDAATVDRLLLESGVTRAQIKTLFDHENRIRVLEGRPEVTVEKLKTALWKLIRS